MSKDRKIAYVKHPITTAQKKEICAKGLRIIDARFAPEGADIIDPNAKTKTQSKSPAEPPRSAEDVDKLLKSDLVNFLKGHGVEDPKGKVPELREQLKAIMFTNL
ncbi:hypothetical protein [Pelagimonas sp. KU-00592-HH]|uniref:hypothetical protein n=1 Tax=Pelagimonas sp. KU-00592-HH TaxID=3127651 RepID=UPI0033410699